MNHKSSGLPNKHPKNMCFCLRWEAWTYHHFRVSTVASELYVTWSTRAIFHFTKDALWHTMTDASQLIRTALFVRLFVWPNKNPSNKKTHHRVSLRKAGKKKPYPSVFRGCLWQHGSRKKCTAPTTLLGATDCSDLGPPNSPPRKRRPEVGMNIGKIRWMEEINRSTW